VRTRTLYRCRDCGFTAAKWLGRCPDCGAWDTLAESTSAGKAATAAGSRVATLRSYAEIEEIDTRRLSSGVAEFDRVLGGGLVPGAVVLLGGEPGIGKSTLALQVASCVAETARPVLYVTGEESPGQLRTRGDRLGVSSPELLVAAETEVGAVIEAARSVNPALLVLDSVQTLRTDDVGAAPGSVSQLRECAARIVEYAKASATPVILVGHVTKDGAIAGPRLLEHVVDAVLQFEGDRHHEHRVLRALKNRFGSAEELGVFRMTPSGLAEVADPSELLLAERHDVPGSVVLAAVHGSRPLLVEVQALVGDPSQGPPRRTAVGVDSHRVALLLAVLQRCGGLDLAARDVFVNVTGGLTVDEPAADLAVVCAVAASARQIPMPPGSVVAGEVGLTGEVRAVARLDTRLREAARLGFRTALVPAGHGAGAEVGGIRRVALRNVAETMAALFENAGAERS